MLSQLRNPRLCDAFDSNISTQCNANTALLHAPGFVKSLTKILILMREINDPEDS